MKRKPSILDNFSADSSRFWGRFSLPTLCQFQLILADFCQFSADLAKEMPELLDKLKAGELALNKFQGFNLATSCALLSSFPTISLPFYVFAIISKDLGER